MIRRSSLIAAEIVLGLAAALIIGLGVAWWRLSQGPVELNFIREHVQSELSRAREGRPVGIDRVELAWSNNANALELRAVGISIEDGRGAVISRADRARIELDALPLLWGHIALRGAEIDGGELTMTRRADGAMGLAFGPPGAPPDILIPPSPENESLEQRVNRVLDALEASFRPVGAGGQLRSLAVRGAKLTIIDESGGGRWTADDAAFELARESGDLTLTASAHLEGANGPAPARLRVVTDTAFQAATVEFGADNARPRALFSQAALGPFGGLDAPLTATIAIGLDRQSGVTSINGEATLGRGIAEMGGGRFSMDGGTVRGRYDIASDELIIDRLQVAGDRTRINGEVRVHDVSRIMRAAPDEPAAFNISLPSLSLDVPGTFAEPMALTEVEITGAIMSAARTVRFDRIHAQTGQGALDASGRYYWAEAGRDNRVHPGIELTGAVAGSIDAPQILNLWPMGLAEGARSFLARALTAGRVSDARIRMDIRPSDMAAEAMRNEAMDIRFNITGGSFQFIDTMSPVTNGRGSAVLQGNRFDMTIPEARMNNLVITNGRVEIPRLKPKGAMATISAHVEGDARNILEVLNQQPLQIGQRLPVSAQTVSGRGAIDLRIQRPMLSEVPFEQWRFTVNGSIDNFAGTMSTRNVALSQGRLTVRGDQRVINVSGPIRAGGSTLNVSWNEFINRRNAASSEYEISGDFDSTDLVRLGYSVAEYAEGRVGVTVTGQGRGFDVDNANIEVDLRNAAVSSPWNFWTKASGVPATVRFAMAKQADGGVLLQNLDGRGGGLSAQGSVLLSRASVLQRIDLTRLAIEGRSDAHLVMQRANDGSMDVRVTGALFDAAPFMESDANLPEAPLPAGATPISAVARAAADPPVRVNVQVMRLRMRGDAMLQNARVETLSSRGALRMLTAEGRAPGGGAFSVGLGPRQSDPSGRIRLRSEDGGFAIRALTGSTNVVGGTASADGDWIPGPPTTARFDVSLRNFQVVQMPAMARLLGSAGSLTGLVEMLNGDGIGFSQLDAPVIYANDRFSVRDARLAGPSMGLTASGSYDVERDNLDVDGVVAPSPMLNLSMLSEVPLIGDLLTSRRGEGVVGMTYSINGHVAEPRVGVNPLSALTPGILRRIFEPLQRPPAADAAPPGPEVAASGGAGGSTQ